MFKTYKHLFCCLEIKMIIFVQKLISFKHKHVQRVNAQYKSIVNIWSSILYLIKILCRYYRELKILHCIDILLIFITKNISVK